MRSLTLAVPTTLALLLALGACGTAERTADQVGNGADTAADALANAGDGLASATGEFGEAGVYKQVIKQIGTDGWLGIGWPEEWGGQARSMVEQLIFTDVAADFGVPIPYLTLNTVGPTIMPTAATSRRSTSSPGSSRASCTSRSATPSRARAPT